MNFHSGKSEFRATSRKQLVRETFRDEGENAALAQARKFKIKEGSARTWISSWRNEPRVLGIRDLQKISGKAISELPGTTPVKSGDRTIALLIPLKRANMDRLRATLNKAEKLAKGRDPREDDAALAKFGDVDPANWSVAAVRELQAGHRHAIKKRQKKK